MTFPVILLYILVIGEGLVIAWLASYLDGIGDRFDGVSKRINGVVRDTNEGFKNMNDAVTTLNDITERAVGVIDRMNQNYFGLKEDIESVDKSQKEIRTYYMNYVSRKDNNGN